MDERGFTCLVSAITPASVYSRGIIALVREKDQNARRIASFSAFDSGFSRSVARGVDRYGAEHGFEVRRFEFRTGREDFSELLPEALEYEPDVIIGMGRANDDLLLAGKMIETGAKPRAAALAVASIGLFRETFGDYAEGFISSSQWEKVADDNPDAGPTSAEFFARYMAAYGRAPDFVAAQGYNIGVIIEKCVEAAGTLDGKILRATARGIDLRTFYGRFKTDSNGSQTGHEMVTVQWQGGKKVIVYPELASSGRLVYPAQFNY
jgi:branched-chain amino acid transport system substrate-binding protein